MTTKLVDEAMARGLEDKVAVYYRDTDGYYYYDQGDDMAASL